MPQLILNMLLFLLGLNLLRSSEQVEHNSLGVSAAAIPLSAPLPADFIHDERKISVNTAETNKDSDSNNTGYLAELVRRILIMANKNKPVPGWL